VSIDDTDEDRRPELRPVAVSYEPRASYDAQGRVETDPRAYASRIEVRQAASAFAGALNEAMFDAAQDPANASKVQRVVTIVAQYESELRAKIATAYADGWGAAEAHRLKPNETPEQSAAREKADAEAVKRTRAAAEEHTRFAMANPGLGIQGLRTH